MRLLITGATSGLGERTAHALAAAGHTPICLGRDAQRVAAVATAVRGEPCIVDLRRLADERAVAGRLEHVDTVIVNAAVQHVRESRETAEGIEETLAVNYLTQVALVWALFDSPHPPCRVVVVSSDTHDADRRTGTPPPLIGSLSELADARRGTGSPRDLGMRRYVTTKQLLTAFALGLADEHPDVHVMAYNPGLMPGTGLDREYPPAFRAFWKVMVRSMLALPFTSTTQRSARALAQLATEEPPSTPSGSYVDFKLRVQPPSTLAADISYQRTLRTQTQALIQDREQRRPA